MLHVSMFILPKGQFSGHFLRPKCNDAIDLPLSSADVSSAEEELNLVLENTTSEEDDVAGEEDDPGRHKRCGDGVDGEAETDDERREEGNERCCAAEDQITERAMLLHYMS